MSERDDDFLARWSRRKTEVRDGGLEKKSEVVHKAGRMRTEAPEPKVIAPESELPGEAGADGDAEVLLTREASLQDQQAPAEIPETKEDDAGAPEPVEEDTPENYEPGEFDDVDFEKLNYASDYSRFMKEGVPEAIRRRALRMLWSSNPILANIDGLNDYDEDFTDAALAVKVLSSNYKPGTGYLTEEERIASYSEEARKAGPEPVEDDPDDQDDLDVEDMEDDEPGDEDAIASAEPEGEEADGNEEASAKDDGTA